MKAQIINLEGTPSEIKEIMNDNRIDSQVSTGDESSMFSKASIRKPSDELSNPKEDSCKPETLPDTHSQIKKEINKDYDEENWEFDKANEEK